MIAWTIAGSDSGGGAGIQADLRTFHGLGVHGCCVVTAITAQNSLGVTAVETVPPGMIEKQWKALAVDLFPRAVKIGMLGTAATAAQVADLLRSIEAFAVCDPVLTASRGGTLLDRDGHSALMEMLVPRVDLLTPNRPEAAALLGTRIESDADVEQAAAQFLARGARSVLIKGGHAAGAFAQDYWTDGKASAWLTSPRLDTPHGHGGGCTLASAIAAFVALGLAPLDAVVMAKAYISQALRAAMPAGAGRGSVVQGGWPASADDMPWLTPSAPAGTRRMAFPDCGEEPLGLYPIVDRAAWLAKLLPLGVRTIQLRIKDLAGAELEREVAEAVRLARHHGARLFINDHWALALAHGAYGVHLGQDDLPSAPLDRIHAAGLRLGLSTHGPAEIARARAVIPSYIAIGTVFPSPSKNFAHQALGVEMLARLAPLCGAPVVAIGGITLERAADVRKAGAAGIAVISDVTRAADLAGRVGAWLKEFGP